MKKPYHITQHVKRMITANDEVLLVCGIANPKPLKQYLLENAYTYYQLDYSDHHIFSIDDLKEIHKKFTAITAPNKFILTTEKDAVRLLKFKEQLTNFPLYVLPIKHRFLFNEAALFDEAVINFVANFSFPVQQQNK